MSRESAALLRSVSLPPPAPVLRWVGGKSALTDRILDLRPSLMRRYVEPFLGGGAVFFALRASGWDGPALLCDLNPHLVNCYRVIRDEPEALLRILSRQRNTERDYYALRKLDPAELLSVPRAAWFLALNKLCFQGLWRVNRAGRMNVPYGHRRTVTIADADAIFSASKALQGAQLECVPFTALADEIREGDFVYQDPPFFPVSKTADFTGYTAAGFTDADQRKLARLSLSWAKRGARVVLSNADVPAARKLYRCGFQLHSVQMRRAINRDASKRGPVGELLAVAGGES